MLAAIEAGVNTLGGPFENREVAFGAGLAEIEL